MIVLTKAKSQKQMKPAEGLTNLHGELMGVGIELQTKANALQKHLVKSQERMKEIEDKGGSPLEHQYLEALAKRLSLTIDKLKVSGAVPTGEATATEYMPDISKLSKQYGKDVDAPV